MSEMRSILSLWKHCREQGDEPLLATVVRVLGSSYRKPGARMLLTRGGRRAGTISGGCLEAEVAKKAWWLTESGAVVQRYSSFFDEDGSEPFGLGCGGTVDILLERGASAAAMLEALASARRQQEACVAVHVLEAEGGALGLHLILRADGSTARVASDSNPHVAALAREVMERRASQWGQILVGGACCEVFAEYVPAPVELLIFGAGDDVQPLVAYGHSLDWIVTVADGRSHLARAERFPLADRVIVTDLDDPLRALKVNGNTAAVLMTHSYQQDRSALSALLQQDIAFLGVLGPRRRTARLISEAGTTLSEEACWARIHSPVGLDVGADTPSSIALAIAAEVLAALRDRNGMSLRLKAAGPSEDAPQAEAKTAVR